MNRRHFFRSGTTAAISLFALPYFEFGSKRVHKENSGEPSNFLLDEITIEILQSKMEKGEFTARRIVQLYLDRIGQIDKKGPKINAIIELNPDALAIADLLDKERKQGKLRGPMHGIPMLIKDNIDTADKMMTTAGSIAMLGNIADRDAFIVAHLRKAGAVILGKTNLSEWANFRSSRSVSGWSSRGGQTKNPYVLDRSPCGSSSGSGAAVAANLCVVAVGTETNGSIACPASMNALVGIKPTVGLLSRSGIIPIAATQDTPGPMTRTVTDAAILLGAMTGQDPLDASMLSSAGKSFSDYTPFLKRDSLKGKRIGVEKTMLKKHEGMDLLFKNAIEQLSAQGAEIIEVEFAQFSNTDGAGGIVLQYEFKDGLNKYLTNAKGRVHSLQELIAFNKANEKTAMPDFKQETLEKSQTRGGLTDEKYTTALEKVINVRKLIDNLLLENNLDALCGPATGPSWCIDPLNGDFWTGYGAYGPAALAGYPSITVPMGNVSEIPVGLSFIGKAFDEPALIGIGYAYEQATKHRSKPKFLPNIKS
jgi:amidase